MTAFAEFAALCAALAATRSRLAKTRLVGEFLRRLDPAEVPPAVALLTARPFSAADPRVLEVSWATLRNALAAAGPGAAAPALMLGEVAAAFAEIAAVSGPGAKRARTTALASLLARATEDERRTLGAILLGEMRIGLHDGLVQEAIAQAAGVGPGLVRRAALFLSDPAEVARLALVEGVPALERAGVRLFVPLLPMLAEVADGFDEVFAAQPAGTALEVKYDGARVQVHREGGVVRIWSRRLSEVTASLPEVAAIVRGELAGERCILDGEVIGVGADGRPLPFQDLMRRWRRVHAVEATARDIPVVLRLFDCLLLDDRPMVDDPHAARWETLERITGGRHLAQRLIPADRAQAEAFLAAAIGADHEGVMAKALDSPYAPGSRVKRWLKVKPAETLDCVVVAADWGSGRRRGWLSNYHLAVADGTGGFAPVGKTFKGLTDQEFREMTARLQALATGDDGYTVTVRPEVVVEVAYNEIQRSPQYSSGFALRFARITRVRDDTGPQQATTLATLRALYERRAAAKGRAPEPP